MCSWVLNEAVKIGAFAQLVRLGGEGGIVEHAEDHALGAGALQRPQQIGRVAARAAAGIVGDVGQDDRLAPAVAADRDGELDGVGQAPSSPA